MRPASLVLPLLLLAGCADVQHTLVRTDEDALAWRVRLVPHEPLPPGVDEVLHALEALAPDTVRAWRDDADQLVLQGRFTDLEAYQDYVRDGLATVTSLVGPVPARLQPPSISRDTDGRWSLDQDVAAGPGRWVLRLDGPAVIGTPDHRVLGGLHTWEAPPDQPHRVEAALSAEPPPSLASFLIQGGPALAAALAGLGMLMWVNRRTRRRLPAGAT